MAELSAEGRRVVEEVATRHGVSVAAAEALLAALVAGGGTQAQFSVPELGGMGQWSRGGMVMVGDMFNTGLKARVDALCSELAGLVGTAGTFAPAPVQSQGQGGASLFVAGTGSAWWPGELGSPASTGGQNDMRYAYFPATRRLAIEADGRVVVYDTGEHRLGGFSQQQSGDRSLSFSGDHGPVRLADLRVVSGSDEPPAPAAAPSRAEPTAAGTAGPGAKPAPTPAAGAPATEDVFGKIERLADLFARGILTTEEYEGKKAELLARL